MVDPLYHIKLRIQIVTDFIDIIQRSLVEIW